MKLRRSLAQSALTMFAAAAMASLVACAAGAEGTGSDDDVPIDAARVDSPNNPNVDARIDAPSGQPDARLIDAPTSLPDAPIGLPDGGGTLESPCTSSTTCGADAPCCLLGFGACFPDPGTPALCAP